jgi:hypothetical protein
MNRMNRIGKKKSKNRSHHQPDRPRKSALAKSHPVNPVPPVQNVFLAAARRAVFLVFLCGKKTCWTCMILHDCSPKTQVCPPPPRRPIFSRHWAIIARQKNFQIPLTTAPERSKTASDS